MKKICLLAMFALLLTGCGKSYEEADERYEDFGNGYFVTIKEWSDEDDTVYDIVYAKDTKVMYFVATTYRKFGITPIYNSDGSLQVYDGE